MAFRRRGAPFTFDAAGFVDLVRKLREAPVTACDEPEIVFRAPSFDHALKDPVEKAIAVSSQTKLVIVEGNYTLLNEDPWSEISGLVDDRSVPTSCTVVD
jgi:pantothenate kinase